MSVAKGTSSKRVHFIRSFLPIYYFSRACGMMPFSITYNSLGEPLRPRIGKRDGMWLIFSIGLYVTTIALIFHNLHLPDDPNSVTYILLLCDNSHLILTLVFGIFIMGIDLCNRFKIVDVLRKFTIFDKEASSILYPFFSIQLQVMWF